MSREAYALLKLALPTWWGERCRGVAVDLTGGLGDFVLLFSRFLKVAALDKGIPLFLIYGSGAPDKAKSELIELMKTQSWCPSHLVKHGDIDALMPILENYDACLDLNSLLDLFADQQTKTLFIENYPCPRWEAEADPKLRLLIPEDSQHKPIIGLCVEAGKDFFPDPGRSMSPAQVKRLVLSTPDINWVNLHPTPIDLPGMLNLQQGSIKRFASVIQACTAIVSVDTFCAHLAAALSKQTFLVLQANPPTWIWNFGNKWYPSSMRIFRTWKGIDDAIDQVIPVLGSLSMASPQRRESSRVARKMLARLCSAKIQKRIG